ncbi:MAG: primosomal protein N' [Chloroflexi bacterium]|nr:primosomal protein N' [Chloroflexota bacterium]
MTQFAEIAVYSGRPHRETFTYRIPDGLAVLRGHALFVPFGRRVLQGVVLRLADSSDIADPRPIHAFIEEEPVITPAQAELAVWMADYYQAPIFSAVALFLEPGFERNPVRLLSPAPVPDAALLAHLSQRQQDVLDIITGAGQIDADRLDERLRGKTGATVRALLERGLVEESFALAQPKLRRRLSEMVELAVSRQAAEAAIDAWPQSRRSRQADLLEQLREAPLPLDEARRIATRPSLERWLAAGSLIEATAPGNGAGDDAHDDACVRLAIDQDAAASAIASLRRTAAERRAVALLRVLLDGPRVPSALHAEAGASRKDVDELLEAGLLRRTATEVEADPLAGYRVERIFAPALTADQQRATAALGSALNNANAARIEGRLEPGLFLLNGVTGSGKTEVYLDAVDHARQLGLRAIVLVPEISLTPQTVERFLQRFDNVAVWHSGLTPQERLAVWRRMRAGDVDVVVGSRSALFAPLPQLGLIIVDEEHEWTYKQHEPPPRYLVRDTAIEYANRSGAVVVFGSATPDVVTAAAARYGTLQELSLPQRVMRVDPADPESALQSAPLPIVDVVDMREELRGGNRSIFSVELASAIETALEQDEQIILFMNRRGSATMVCRSCGATRLCDRCSVPLTYHAAVEELRCHECGSTATPGSDCPTCHSRMLRPMGLGTESLEAAVRERFPAARTLRFDRDTAGAPDGHARILRRFREGEANVLVGTQMLAKGHDIPSVTLVGVVNADLALRLPDYTGPERTFQLLTQVAGRAARGPRGGRVVIQTYAPDHYAITAAAAHDYETFLAQELSARAEHDYPPFGRLARLTYGDRDRGRARDVARHMAASLEEDRVRRGLPGEVLGPTPAYIYRRRNLFRFQVTLRAPDPLPLLRVIDFPRGWSVDIDPVSLI